MRRSRLRWHGHVECKSICCRIGEDMFRVGGGRRFGRTQCLLTCLDAESWPSGRCLGISEVDT